MNSYLLSGSFAYDTILSTKTKFSENILEKEISHLNVSFGIDDVEEQFGGTGGNIAYNAGLLKDNPLLIGNLGLYDGKKYIKRLEKLNLDCSNLKLIENSKTAHAFILSDGENNQITSFYSGAMKYQCSLPEKTPNIWHLAPENPINTALLAQTAINLKKEYFFDPGQCTPLFLKDITANILSLKSIIQGAKGIFVNEYEWSLLKNKFDLNNPLEILKEDQFFIKTLGSKGVELYTNQQKLHIEVSKPDRVVDSTGCGDAFRAGFLHLYHQGYDLKDCVELGVIMGSCAIENYGGQNHTHSHIEIFEKLKVYKNKSHNKLKI